MAVRIAARHVVVRMIARDHHHRHERDLLDAVRLELRHHRLKRRPALDRVDEDILEPELIDLRLDDGVIRVRHLRRAMRHDEDGLILLLLRELRLERLDGLRHIVRLLLLALPVHERRAERHLLELVLVVLVDALVIGILHARDDIEGRERDARVAVALELLERLLRRRILDALVLRDAVDDDMARERRDDLDIGVRRLDGLDRRVDRLRARVLERRAEAHDDDGVLVRLILKLGRLVLQHADLRRLLERRRRILDLWVQGIGRLRHRRGKADECRDRKRCCKHVSPIFHRKSPFAILLTSSAISTKDLSPPRRKPARSPQATKRRRFLRRRCCFHEKERPEPPPRVPSPSFVGTIGDR